MWMCGIRRTPGFVIALYMGMNFVCRDEHGGSFGE